MMDKPINFSDFRREHPCANYGKACSRCKFRAW